MRIDKYLKLTRLIKRRTVAKELLDRGMFLINDRVAKPSSEVNVGDVIFLPLGRHKLTVRVWKMGDHETKDNAHDLYEVVKDEIVKEFRDEPQEE